MRPLVGLVAGSLFGLGLAISGLIDPARVLGFLDVAGHWDPSLAFVMGGAAAVAFVGFRMSGHMRRPLFAERFDLPSTNRIDGRLLSGAALFGMGWGMGGLCPGPAVAGLSVGHAGSFVFVAAMLVGMALYRIVSTASRPKSA
jgi:uncharacterized membrane protein YedE/YeeE